MKRLVIVIVAACGSKPPTPQPVSDPTTVVTTPASQPSMAPPLKRGTKVACEQLIDAAAFAKALGESDPLTVRDDSKQNVEAAGVCSLVRGGAPLSKAEQEKRLKLTGRLGVLPGDTVCEVAVYCWTYEDIAHAQQQCDVRGGARDKSMGATHACRELVAQGAGDVARYHVLDNDTGCMLRVNGGPANVDNESIYACARTALDTITPARLK